MKLSFPHPLILLFFMLCLVTLLTHIVPAGLFERVTLEGRTLIVPGTFQHVAPNGIGFMAMLTAIPKGFKAAIDVIFVVFASGIMFGILDKTQAVNRFAHLIIHFLGHSRRFWVVGGLTYFYGMIGIFIGYENTIALVPIAVAVTYAIGGDLILAAGMAVGGITVGFGLSPINPFTVGTGHFIAGLPLFSGAGLRSMLCFSALAVLSLANIRYLHQLESGKKNAFLDEIDIKENLGSTNREVSLKHGLILLVLAASIGIMIFGIMKWEWYLQEIAALFLMTAIAIAITAGIGGNQFAIKAFQSVSLVAPGVFMIGFAASIKVVLESGQITDSLAYYMSETLMGLPLYGVAIGMTLTQSLLNFLIPSGSGQALATLPIMLPLGEIMGMTKQLTILAFQIGDGVTNLINPTLGGLLAMLGIINMPFDRWLKFILPVMFSILILSWVFLIIAVAIGYGPF